MQFEWDDANIQHLGEHGVEPDEAEDCFYNPATEPELQKVNGEPRFRFEGSTDSGRLLTVVYTLRRGRVRVITAFKD
jgi:uncharacterized DUF497 family protein